MKKCGKTMLIGALAGFLNGFLGSGGGIISVPLFKKTGLSVKESHATSLLMMFFLSAVSAGLYLYEGRLSLQDAAGFLPGGIPGAFASALFFRKINPALLRKIFGGFMIFSALRIIWGIIFG